MHGWSLAEWVDGWMNGWMVREMKSLEVRRDIKKMNEYRAATSLHLSIFFPLPPSSPPFFFFPSLGSCLTPSLFLLLRYALSLPPLSPSLFLSLSLSLILTRWVIAAALWLDWLMHSESPGRWSTTNRRRREKKKRVRGTIGERRAGEREREREREKECTRMCVCVCVGLCVHVVETPVMPFSEAAASSGLILRGRCPSPHQWKCSLFSSLEQSCSLILYDQSATSWIPARGERVDTHTHTHTHTHEVTKETQIGTKKNPPKKTSNCSFSLSSWWGPNERVWLTRALLRLSLPAPFFFFFSRLSSASIPLPFALMAFFCLSVLILMMQ